MKVELLILIHELEQQRHLMSPLYLTSAGSTIPPLILATMVSTFSLGASPFTYLSSMTQDILKYLIKLPGPPSPAQPLDMVSVLRSMSATLSACVFQSLMCGREEGDTNVSGESTVFVNMIYSQKVCQQMPPTNRKLNFELLLGTCRYFSHLFFCCKARNFPFVHLPDRLLVLQQFWTFFLNQLCV